MSSLTIYTLLMTIRGFSNEITVRALSDKLGISYSTLARCKNGVWPRSITFDAMRSVLATCRERFFDNDEEAFVVSTLLQLRSQGVEDYLCDDLEKTYRKDGYERFVSDLLSYAKDPESRPVRTDTPPEEGAPTIEGAPQPDSAAPSPSAPECAAATAAVSEPEAVDATPEKPEHAMAPAHTAAPAPNVLEQTARTKRELRLHDFLLAIPVIVLFLLAASKFSPSDAFAWAARNQTLFFTVSFFIAISPVVAGTLIDAPIAWFAYKRAHPDVAFSLKGFAHVSKYGAEQGIREGAGRYSLGLSYLAYQPICNLLGMMCYTALFATLLTLPGFIDFVTHHEWTNFLSVGIFVAFLIAYDHAHDQYQRPLGNKVVEGVGENPDNYLPTRANVWANTIHLVWTNSLLIILLLNFLAYSIVMFRTTEMPVLMLWPFLQGMLFFYYACISKRAVRLRATAVGIFLLGVLTTCLSLFVLAAICYTPSLGGTLLCGACMLCTIGALAWARTHLSDGDSPWLVEGKNSRAYSIMMAATIFLMAIVGVVTSSFS